MASQILHAIHERPCILGILRESGPSLTVHTTRTISSPPLSLLPGQPNTILQLPFRRPHYSVHTTRTISSPPLSLLPGQPNTILQLPFRHPHAAPNCRKGPKTKDETSIRPKTLAGESLESRVQKLVKVYDHFFIDFLAFRRKS